MRIWNTLTRKKEEFQPIQAGHVGLYTCGPTVYNYAHIGNLRTYIFEDILERTLVLEGYRVKRVMNITDVGHLTSDADAGEDKLEKEAKKESRSVWDIAKFYTNAFFEDLTALNIKKPEFIEPATSFIQEQIAIIERLFKNGYAYETPTAVYFDVSKFKNYTALSRQKLEGKGTAVRTEVVEDSSKRGSHDFVLWFKLVGHFANHTMRWPSPWGEGFPGWHIECSAISSSLLGQPFDIHTGGIDHISVHHTNEIAQSEGAFGKPLAHYWMHGEFLIIDQARMGKSLGNFLTLATLREKGFNPLAYRYFVLTAHYRSPLNFTWDNLSAAEAAYRKLLGKIQLVAGGGGEEPQKTESASGVENLITAFTERFETALADDLNTPQALAALHDLVNDLLTLKAKGSLSPVESLSFLAAVKKADSVLGLDLAAAAKIPASVRKLAEERELCRNRKQFTPADDLRKRIRALGYEVDDTPLGPFVHPIYGSHNEPGKTPAAGS